MSGAGDIYNPSSWCCSEYLAHEQVREQEVPDVICAELRLYSIDCLRVRSGHYACVCDQDVEFLDLLVYDLDGRADGGLRGEV